jgi:hypothetical protein
VSPENEYRPWESLGVSETEYWKQRYLEARIEAHHATEGLRTVVREELERRWPVAEGEDRKGQHMSYEELLERVGAMNESAELMLSNQYGMLLLLNDKNQVVLSLSHLVSREERMRNA